MCDKNDVFSLHCTVLKGLYSIRRFLYGIISGIPDFNIDFFLFLVLGLWLRNRCFCMKYIIADLLPEINVLLNIDH